MKRLYKIVGYNVQISCFVNKYLLKIITYYIIILKVTLPTLPNFSYSFLTAPLNFILTPLFPYFYVIPILFFCHSHENGNPVEK